MRQDSSTTLPVKEVPESYSRQKALSVVNEYSDIVGKRVEAYPAPAAIAHLQMLHTKIGADGDLPDDYDERTSWLADLWQTMYLKNNLVPGDIPFPIIIREFTTAMVQGRAERKGNNQAALCQAFNQWISQQNVRNRLYELRDQVYPENKPKQIEENATEPTIADYSDEVLKQKLEAIKPMAGLKTADMMIAELEEEIERRKG